MHLYLLQLPLWIWRKYRAGRARWPISWFTLLQICSKHRARWAPQVCWAFFMKWDPRSDTLTAAAKAKYQRGSISTSQIYHYPREHSLFHWIFWDSWRFHRLVSCWSWRICSFSWGIWLSAGTGLCFSLIGWCCSQILSSGWEDRNNGKIHAHHKPFSISPCLRTQFRWKEPFPNTDKHGFTPSTKNRFSTSPISSYYR